VLDGTIMTRLSRTPLLLFALLTVSSAARAEPPPMSFDPTLMAAPPVCAPGTRVACTCPNGARGSQECQWPGLRFSVCACASVVVALPPIPVLPDVSLHAPRPRPPEKRSSGLGMLIGGSITLGIGTANLIWGIERVRTKSNDALGIVMISTGGVAMAVGLPLTIVGIVYYATRPKEQDRAQQPRKSQIEIAPTPTGLAIHF
jgi:hypothetical protein